MAENQAAIQAQVDQVKKEIRESRISQRLLDNASHLSREQLLTFDMIERHPLITDQKAYEFRWDEVDGLYQFVDRLPAWIVDDDIMALWGTGEEDAPQSFKCSQTKKGEFGQALLLSRAPAMLSGAAASQNEKVFSAVVVCVHPCQDLMSIKDGASDLMSFAHSKPGKSISALCQLPRKSAKAFYPSPLNDSFLILPYFAFPGEQKRVHLNAAIGLNKHFVVRRLHRRRAPGGDLAVLPPIYSKDPSVPGTLEVGYMGPMWVNTVHVTVMPEGGTGLFLPADQNVRPAISMVQFCPEEMDARSSLAPLVGDNVVYPERWRDKPYEIQEVEKARCPRRDGSDRDSSESDGEPGMDGTPAAPPPTRKADSSDEEEDAKSGQASHAGSHSDANNGGSGTGSADSSRDSSSSGSNHESDAQSEANSDASKRRVRRKKKPKGFSSEESDDAQDAVKISGLEDGAKTDRTAGDSGVGKGANGMSSMGPSGDGRAALAGLRHMSSARGSLPLPTTLPSMATLESLTNDLESYSDELYKQLEETNLKVYQKVLAGFKNSGGVCKTFIHEMGALAVTFFAKAEDMEGGLAKTDAQAFEEAMEASKTHVIRLIQEVSEAEDIYDSGEAKFDKILASVAEEIKVYIQQQGATQRATYKRKCLDRIRQDHGRLDGTCFVPMIVGNLTAHRALAMSQRVAQSHVPLQIMMAPLRTQAGAVKVYTKFIEFLARRVVALQEKLGPGITAVNLESEAADHSVPAGRGRSSSASPTRDVSAFSSGFRISCSTQLSQAVHSQENHA